jgi:hypothetical protein
MYDSTTYNLALLISYFGFSGINIFEGYDRGSCLSFLPNSGEYDSTTYNVASPISYFEFSEINIFEE